MCVYVHVYPTLFVCYLLSSFLLIHCGEWTRMHSCIAVIIHTIYIYIHVMYEYGWC